MKIKNTEIEKVCCIEKHKNKLTGLCSSCGSLVEKTDDSKNITTCNVCKNTLDWWGLKIHTN